MSTDIVFKKITTLDELLTNITSVKIEVNQKSGKRYTQIGQDRVSLNQIVKKMHILTKETEKVRNLTDHEKLIGNSICSMIRVLKESGDDKLAKLSKIAQIKHAFRAFFGNITGNLKSNRRLQAYQHNHFKLTNVPTNSGASVTKKEQSNVETHSSIPVKNSSKSSISENYEKQGSIAEQESAQQPIVELSTTVPLKTPVRKKSSEEIADAHLAGAIVRKKIKTIKQNALKEIEKPLTEKEFEFLSSRSIGLRFSGKADLEFIEGLHGDAVSLSGVPCAFQEYKNWLNEESGSKCPINYDFKKIIEGKNKEEVMNDFENNVKQFVARSISAYGFQIRHQGDSIQLDVNDFKNKSIKLLLGNFNYADMPYDITAYCNLGKCGKQYIGKGKDSGKFIKWVTTEKDFFEKLSIDLGSTCKESRDSLSNEAAEYLWKKIRLQIRILAAINTEFST